MTTYNTGNPLGSVDPRDLYDNAENLDDFSNGPLNFYTDRLGVSRESLQGIRNASQYQNIGAYGAGLVFTSYNQTFSYLGDFYAPSAGLTLPYTTTGAGAGEIASFRSVGDAVLRSDLAAIGAGSGAAIIGRASQVVGSQSALKGLDKNAASKHAFLTGYASQGDGGGGAYYLDSADIVSADNGGTIIVADDGGRWKLAFSGRVQATVFGVFGGNLATDYASKVQSAVTVGCTSHGGVDFPAGPIRVDTTITFPNTAFDLHGASGTGTEFVTDVASLTILDFSACNGPAKTVNNIGLSKITGGTYGNITAIKTFNTNGLLLNSVWARGLAIGLQYHGSFINMNQCVFEFCNIGVRCLTPCVETAWIGTTFYKCETSDVELTGDNATFASSNSNHIGTRIVSWRLVDCINASISQISFIDDGTGFLPDLINLSGNCSGNSFNNVTSSGYGKRAIACIGSGVVRNRFTNLQLSNVAATDNRGVFTSGTAGNYFEGNISGYEAGVEALNTSDEFNLRVTGCSVGQVINTADFSTWSIFNIGNTVDFDNTGTTIVNLKHFEGSRAGLATIPFILANKGFSSILEVTAFPAALSWLIGDIAVNRSPAVGSPKGWVCTVSGTPGTWVSQGNL